MEKQKIEILCAFVPLRAEFLPWQDLKIYIFEHL